MGNAGYHLAKAGQSFSLAQFFFQEQPFDKAENSFEQCLRHRPTDKSVLLYLHTLRGFKQTSVPENFDGCIELTEK